LIQELQSLVRVEMSRRSLAELRLRLAWEKPSRLAKEKAFPSAARSAMVTAIQIPWAKEQALVLPSFLPSIFFGADAESAMVL